MAGRMSPEDKPTHDKTCTQMTWPFSDHPGDVPCQLLIKTSHTVEHP